MKICKYLKLLTFILAPSSLMGLWACSVGSNQDTERHQAKPFVSKLFGQTTKTLALPVEIGDEFAWIGLEQAGDYQYFQIDRLASNGEVINEPETATSSFVADPIVIPAPSASLGTQNQLLLTVTYRPLVAIEADAKPHQASLILVQKKPSLKTIQVELFGYTQGVNVSKCTRSPDAMTRLDYTLKTGTLNLYICDSNGIPNNQVTEGAPGVKTNLTPIKIESDFVFYQPDSETVCFLGSDKAVEDGGKPDPTIPDFDLPIPKGISEVTDSLEKLSVAMVRSLKAECSLTETNLVCEENIELSIFGGRVPVKPLIVTTGTETPVSRDCQDFGEISGSEGGFGEDEFKLVAWTEVLGTTDTEEFNIDGALVVAEIELQLK